MKHCREQLVFEEEKLDLYEGTGYIPVVDMKNYKSVYHEKGTIGTVNTWEFFLNRCQNLV